LRADCAERRRRHNCIAQARESQNQRARVHAR
jgi:hypothetical protein